MLCFRLRVDQDVVYVKNVTGIPKLSKDFINEGLKYRASIHKTIWHHLVSLVKSLPLLQAQQKMGPEIRDSDTLLLQHLIL